MIVGGDDHRRAETVQFDKQAQQAARHLGVNVAGGLVGEQQLGLGDDGAGDGGALLLAARQHGWEGMHAIAEADPL